MMVDVTCIWAAEAVLGEGPLWVESESCLYWLDIKQSIVHRFCTLSHNKTSWPIAEQVSSLAKRQQGGLVATVRDGFVVLDLAAVEPVKAIALVEAGLPNNRFNDGKVDASGRYWAGSMDDQEKSQSGALYCLDAAGKVVVKDSGYCISNGPTFSPDGKTLYHTDTLTRTIYQFDLAGDGELSNKRAFYTVPEADGYPDGMTMDAEGCLWLCHFFGARVSRLSPQGVVLSTIPMPVSNITSCTFGGPKFEQLYITTARWALSDEQQKAQPLAGGLFVCTPGVKGFASHAFLG